jgi:hypothetical protein
MGKDLIDLTFYRESASEPWGFRLAGGKDYGQPLSISQVGNPHSGYTNYHGEISSGENVFTIFLASVGDVTIQEQKEECTIEILCEM